MRSRKSRRILRSLVYIPTIVCSSRRVYPVTSASPPICQVQDVVLSQLIRQKNLAQRIYKWMWAHGWTERDQIWQTYADRSGNGHRLKNCLHETPGGVLGGGGSKVWKMDAAGLSRHVATKVLAITNHTPCVLSNQSVMADIWARISGDHIWWWLVFPFRILIEMNVEQDTALACWFSGGGERVNIVGNFISVNLQFA